MCLKTLENKPFLVILLMMLILSFQIAFAQEEGEPAPKYTTGEYNDYQKAVEGGPGTLLTFIKENPDSYLTKEYGIRHYLGLIEEAYKSGQHDETLSRAENFLADIDASNFAAQYYAALSAYLTRNWPKAAKYGQAVYDARPETEGFLSILARAYHSAGDLDHAVPMIESYCGTVEPKDCYDLLPTITAHYAGKKQWAKASEYAQKTIEALDGVPKPAEAADDVWKNYVEDEKSKCYTVLGKQAFESKKWASVEKNHRSSLQLNAKDKVRRAESYYYIGMSLWNREMIDPAMESFARGSKISGTPHAKPCREQLERLYKGTHNGSLAGLEEFLDRVG
ncbi:MAG: hypothetical protein JSU96_00070 [Acidobacteriota bacterium]|nr:MAG: hypothetical protein JSU96_00070 [Acidobacteriota bacterium]